MAREKKFASPGGAKETPAGRLMDTVIENVIRPRGPVRFLPTEEWLDSFVKGSEVRELTRGASHRHTTEKIEMNSTVMDLPLPTLDPAQEVRIIAVHRGFLYEHLYTVGCLFRAAAAGVTSVVVERDEDVEVVLPSRRIYVQVKSRSQPIIPSDIDSALERFSRLRAEHVAGRREGVAHFAIVANQSPGPALAALIASGSLEDDIQFLRPGQPVPAHLDALPPAWRNLGDAIQWCTAQAASVPHAMLVPDSLVWKLAGLVMSAATGQMHRGGHAFAVETLPELFEQLLVQLQDFPAPLLSYRPQIDEPDIDNGARLRIICGFSGAGKTSWASQAATHSTESCVYFNAGDTPGTALASSLVRELAANLVGASPDVLRQVLLPGASGIDSLRSLDVYLAARGRSPIIVIDNAPSTCRPHSCGARSNGQLALPAVVSAGRFDTGIGSALRYRPRNASRLGHGHAGQ
jgi:hypothetical protein